MCGIAGIWTSPSRIQSLRDLDGLVGLMLEQIKHRGPESGGTWSDQTCGLGLGHRRLAIVDLSPSGHQPMSSHTGRYLITLNGEIYNFLEIKSELQSDGRLPPLHGTSDTEIALAAIEAWGIENALQRFNGMFAFGLWDRKKQSLFLARDRVGKKPLYYGRLDECSFVFASEIKSFFPLETFRRKLSIASTELYLELGYVPAPHSIFENVFKLPQGHFVEIAAQDAKPQLKQYWSLPQIIARSRPATTKPRSDAYEQIEELERLLEDSVRIRMISDVPLGAMLSGGIDSSTVVGLMQRVSPRPVKTFSIGFTESSHNEAAFAASVAQHLGTEHEEMYVSATDCLNAVPQMAKIYDEPFSDSSQIPTYLVSKLAKQHVTVCLSGDGGDEVFAGYNRYSLGKRLIGIHAKSPRFALRTISSAIGAISPESWSGIYESACRTLGQNPKISQLGDKIHKLESLLKQENPLNIYLGLIQQWDPSSKVLRQQLKSATSARSMVARYWSETNLSDVERMMLADAMTYLPDDIMVKVDRANMAVALEGRAPLLDYRVIEHAWRMPLDAKLSAHGSKWPLRQILYKMVPREMIERPKMGFGVPMADWLRGPLKEWAGDLLSTDRLSEQGLLDPQVVQQTWQEHISGKRNWQAKLWNVLMLQAWIDETRPIF